MSTLTDSQQPLQHQEVSSSQAPLFSQQSDSQNTQSSVTYFNECEDLVKFAQGGELTPEEFKQQLKSQSQGTPCTPNSLFVSQPSDRSQKHSFDSQPRDVFMGAADQTPPVLEKVSPKSLPASQQSGYFSNEATKATLFSNEEIKTSLFDTPINSQEDKTPTGTPFNAAVEMDDGEDTEVEDQPMESDDRLSGDDERENQQTAGYAFSKANAAYTNGKVEHLNLLINKKQINLNCDKNRAMTVNHHVSIGKSNEQLTILENLDRYVSTVPNGGQSYPCFQSIGKSDSNYFGKNPQFSSEYHQQPVFGKQQPMEVQHNGPYPSYSSDVPHKNINLVPVPGKWPTNQYPGKPQQFYGKHQPIGKSIYHLNSQAMTNYETSTSEYTITELDDCQARHGHGKSINSSVDYRYDAALNLSRSSSPIRYDDELFNDDSNDSLKKRKSTSKLPGHPKQAAKMPKIAADDKRNAEIQSQEECLSQQMKGTSIDASAENSFEQFDQANNYFKGKTKQQPSFIAKKQQDKQQDKPSQIRISPRSARLSRMDTSSPALGKSLSRLDESIETPRKSIATQAYGPLQKPTEQSTKKTRVRRKTDESEYIKKAPVPKRLNISERTNTSVRQSEPVKPSKPKSARKASIDKEPVVEARKARPSRSRKSSVCSSKSSALSDDEDDDESYTGEDSRKERRKLNNKKSAREYRQRKKEQELKLNADIVELEQKYNELRKELKNVLVKKHVQVQSLMELGIHVMPDWTRNIKQKEEHFLI